MRLMLIRHGESEHGVRQLIAGERRCPGRTPHGFTQAQRLADRFRSTREVQDSQVLLSSPVRRERQTAEVLADVLSVVHEAWGISASGSRLGFCFHRSCPHAPCCELLSSSGILSPKRSRLRNGSLRKNVFMPQG
jgi:bisphosphoglycerate-dependent phosphoglycerate mutase